MKKYKEMKNINQVKVDAVARGWQLDFTEFDKGSDWFLLEDINNRMLTILVNCFGRFMVYTPMSNKPIATESSKELDNQKWYQEILNLLYV